MSEFRTALNKYIAKSLIRDKEPFNLFILNHIDISLNGVKPNFENIRKILKEFGAIEYYDRIGEIFDILYRKWLRENKNTEALPGLINNNNNSPPRKNSPTMLDYLESDKKKNPEYYANLDKLGNAWDKRSNELGIRGIPSAVTPTLVFIRDQSDKFPVYTYIKRKPLISEEKFFLNNPKIAKLNTNLGYYFHSLIWESKSEFELNEILDILNDININLEMLKTINNQF